MFACAEIWFRKTFQVEEEHLAKPEARIHRDEKEEALTEKAKPTPEQKVHKPSDGKQHCRIFRGMLMLADS